jgi:hypothetical protein
MRLAHRRTGNAEHTVFARELTSLAGRVFDRRIRITHGAEENDHFTIFFAGIFILRHVITSLRFVRHQRVVLSPVRVDAVAWLVHDAESMASCHRDDQRALPPVRQRDPCHAARRGLHRGERSGLRRGEQNDLRHAVPNGLRHAVLNDLRHAAQNDPRHEALHDLRHAVPNDLRHEVPHDLRHGVRVRRPCAARDVLHRDVRVFLPCVAGSCPRRDGLRAPLLADAQHPGEPYEREPRHGEQPYLAPLPCAQRVLAA